MPLTGEVLLSLAACGSIADAIRPSPVDSAIESYYESHATEQNGQCLNPHIDALTRIEVVEETARRMVVDARYFYRDRFMDGGEVGSLECAGFSERRFRLARFEADIRVLEMSGTAHG